MANGIVVWCVRWWATLPMMEVQEAAGAATSDDEQIGVLVAGRRQQRVRGSPSSKTDAVRTASSGSDVHHSSSSRRGHVSRAGSSCVG